MFNDEVITDDGLMALRVRLFEHNNVLMSVLDTVGALVLVIDRDGCIVCFNRSCENLSGYVYDELRGKPVWEILWREADAKEIKDFFDSLSCNSHASSQPPDEGGLKLENYWISKNGSRRLISWTYNVIIDNESGVSYLLASGIDVTAHRLAERRLEYLTHFDALTDLPNRTLFYDRLSHMLGQARRYNRMFALLFLDLDGFKYVNDTLGHDMGDLLLQKAAKQLPVCVRDSDTVAHIGGDEFVIILSELNKTSDAAIVADKILEVFTKPFQLDNHECVVGVSIGISVYPADGDDIDTLLKNSDVAMYQAKDTGRNNYKFYNSDMNIKAMRRMKLESSLRKALQRNEFTLNFQPKFELSDDKIAGMETLIRWHTPQYGFVSPVEFIPVAEETGLIIPIGEWVLRQACAVGMQWQGMASVPLIMAVNLSARQFKSHDLIKSIEAILKETGYNPELLELELTESVVMEDANSAIKVLRDIKNMGIHIAIDDFGMGYSSLSYLKRFPIDRLKIDKSFVSDITTDPDDAAIATAIIAMAHSLKLKVTAEGVETSEQLEFLRKLNCDEAQGYLFSKPLVPEKFTEFLQGRKIT
ncbi:MAG: EAL domain-containing protein [Nitrospirae bacterium]|nr:EAL domain-containing protein [Nitrospirota bacterium]